MVCEISFMVQHIANDTEDVICVGIHCAVHNDSISHVRTSENPFAERFLLP